MGIRFNQFLNSLIEWPFHFFRRFQKYTERRGSRSGNVLNNPISLSRDYKPWFKEVDECSVC